MAKITNLKSMTQKEVAAAFCEAMRCPYCKAMVPLRDSALQQHAEFPGNPRTEICEGSGLKDMSEVRLGGCEQLVADLSLQVGCCDSCHDDVDHGAHFPLQINTPQGYYEVCCKVAKAYEEALETRGW